MVLCFKARKSRPCQALKIRLVETINHQFNKKEKTAAILLPTHNSEKFLEAQIDSILSQKKINVHFYISDDGSKDRTLKIINSYFKKYPKNFKKLFKVNFYHPSKNFFYLISKVPQIYKYYSLSDHDDVWLDDKLLKSINFIDKGFNVYGCRAKIVDEKLRFLGYSTDFNLQPSFANAIVQGLFSNSTTVFDCNVLRLIKKKIDFLLKTDFDPSWIVYLISTFYGLKVYYDRVPRILYRQHMQNNMGSGRLFFSRLKRLYLFLKGNNKHTNNLHIDFLKSLSGKKPEANVKLLNNFQHMRNKMYFYKFNTDFFRKTGIYRQTKIGNFFLKLGIFLNLE